MKYANPTLSWVVAFLLIGCSDDKDNSPPPVGEGEAEAEGEGEPEPMCRAIAEGMFPAEAEELANAPDEGSQTILDRAWTPINIDGRNYTIGQEPMWEAVRFDLDAPTCVYGMRVQWGNLLGEGERPVPVGAYPDFGSNGFDFDRWNPYWQTDRGLTPNDEGRWIDYVFEEAVEMPIPGIFYVAHLFDPDLQASAEGAPAMRFNGTGNNCENFLDCRSAVNLPEAGSMEHGTGINYNGTSFPFPYNYSVRLMVEVLDTIPDEDKWFQVDDALTASRAAWGDYNNDGWDDLMTGGPTLYRNNGDGSFTDVTATAIDSPLPNGTNGGVWGDFDNDGCLDFFGTAGRGTSYDLLLQSDCDGTFTDATLSSGITDLQGDTVCDPVAVEEHSPTEGAAWVDLDADGYLDLYLANYECWNDGNPIYYLDRIWRNEGNGTFAEWAWERGFTTAREAGRGVSPIDVDRDGDVDVFVSNYRLHPNLMYENLGGTFIDRAAGWGLIGNFTQGAYGHTIGSAWIDLENDGDWDLIESNLAHPRFYHFSDLTMILRNDGSQVFEDIAEDAGIHYRETHSNPTVQDFDNDGDQDAFFTCVYEGRFSEMYFNDGEGHFDQVNYPSGAITYNGWGSTASDFDNDGDVDLVAGPLFRNDTAAEGNHWLQVRAIGGVTANWAAIGAQVEVTADGVTRMGHVSGGSGTGCQDTMYLSFGLGEATQVDEIRVAYPGGANVTVNGPVDADQRVWIYEDGTVTYGWSP